MECKHLLVISLCLSSLMTTVSGSEKKIRSQKTSPQSESPQRIMGKDGAEMVLIPAGEFQMGSDEGKDHEKPVHTVYVDAFYIDVYEVTNAQFQKFVEATGHRKPLPFYDKPKYNQPNKPVIGISWESARDYSEWAGKRLPTEAEWEKAARGGLEGQRYPWGDSINPDQANYGHNVEQPTPVGSYPPENSYGLYDMMGNVGEWCADWYRPDYYQNSPKRNPTGASSGGPGELRVVRGGHYGLGAEWFSNASRRYSSDGRSYNHGFRCAKSVSP
ncbi:MAG: formylglycine-generating enzyme family protein [Candidatus Poribacteria bacterium]|nr:formylglycine-generating enzyme family protein [Candidatus Poribacteria bacterium]